MDALVISSCPMTVCISPCKWSTALGRMPVSAPVDVLYASTVGMLATLGVSYARVVGDEWLLGKVLSSMSAHSDAGW